VAEGNSRTEFIKKYLENEGMDIPEDFYSFDELESSVDDDQITGAEEGFMLGYIAG
jgi:hypothetical protein